MGWIARIIWIGVPGVLFAVAAAAGIVGALSLPDLAGERRLDALDAPVTVDFDVRGIPTIRADSMADAYAALGFLHAEERLWQMEMMRRFAGGRLSEIAGSATLRVDRFARALDLDGRSRRQASKLPQPVRAALDAYASGVNAALGGRNRPLPPEFLIAGIEPAPWEPYQSLLWARTMGLFLSGDWRTERLKSLLLGRVDPAQIDDLFPSYADSATSLTEAEVAAAGNAPARLAGLPDPPRTLSAESASNAWTLSGDLTANGKPILANDPHLGLDLPGTWYMARIETPELTLVGATAPGVPFHVLGHNGTAAWGLTTTHADSMDLITLTPDPEAPQTRYLTDSRSIPYETRQERIPLRGGGVELYEARETVFGPVLPEPAADGTRVALQWAAFKGPDSTPTALFRLNRAKTPAAFAEAARLFDAPVQNMFYADTAGHTALAVAGRLPIRAAGRTGDLPRASDAGDAAWLGITDPADMPIALDPPGGLLANANNRIATAKAAPYAIARDWQPPYRYRRVRAMLQARTDDHTPEDSAAVQTDVLSEAARALMPHLLKAEPTSNRGREALAQLSVWDFHMRRDRAAPAIFAVLLDELVRALAEDDLGPAFQEWWRAEPGFVLAALEPDSGWCDDIRTVPVEDCRWALTAALERTVARLTDKLGGDLSRWRWGDLHTAPFAHSTLTYIPVLNWLSDRPIETGGGDHTPNRGQTGEPGDDEAFAHVHGAGLRAIYDLSDLDASRFAQAGGQSGHPFSAHYADGLDGWRDSRYFRIPGRMSDIEKGTDRRLMLRPQ